MKLIGTIIGFHKVTEVTQAFHAFGTEGFMLSAMKGYG